MIKLIHRYNKIITYVFLFVAICFMFSGVGLDILQSSGVGGSTDYAIKVNDREISALELERAKQNLTARYQSMFGERYESLAKQLNLNITQQTIDSLIDSNLLIQEAARWGFAGSDDGVNRYLLTKVFTDREVSKEAITNMLQNLGMNYRQFSSEIKDELSREAFTNLVRDAAYVTDRDVQDRYTTQETKLSLLVASLDPSSLNGEVAQPSEELIAKSYNQNATSYEVPARISYEYIVFSPQDFAKDVPINAQDLELYYTENLNRFKTPEQARIKAITKLYPKDADPKAMADLKATAKSIHEEALSGKPFATLVTQYSDDMPTKLAGGDRGWVERGKGSKAFDKAVFSTQAGAIAELIESDIGFEIVLVEERRAAGQKEFATVKGEIEQTLRQREAPAYASAKAIELVREVKDSKGTLRGIAASRPGMPETKVVSLGTDADASDPLVKGLTKKALQLPASDRLIATTVDIGDSTVALQVLEFKEPIIRPLSEVRDQVIRSYRENEARLLAEKRANELLEAIKGEPNKLEPLAKERGFGISGPHEISRQAPTVEALAEISGDINRDLFSSTVAPRALGRVFKGTNKGSVSVVVVTKATPPDLKTKESLEGIKKFRDEALQQEAQATLSNTVALLKARSSVDIAPGVMAR